MLLELLGKILRHQLMEKVYDALVAQLELAINHYDRGLIIKVNGFNHKLHVSLQHLINFSLSCRLIIFFTVTSSDYR